VFVTAWEPAREREWVPASAAWRLVALRGREPALVQQRDRQAAAGFPAAAADCFAEEAGQGEYPQTDQPAVASERALSAAEGWVLVPAALRPEAV